MSCLIIHVKTMLEIKNAMSESRVLSYSEGAPRHSDAVITSVAISCLVAAIGWFLVWDGVWELRHAATALISFVILAGVVNHLWIVHQPAVRFGEANQATMLRSGLVCVIGSALLAPTPLSGDLSWLLLGVIVIALALDAADGFLARKLGLCSPFGARFDMEIDALLLMILSLLVWRTGQAGAWVLAIGLMRYAFVAASWIYPALNGPLDESFRRKVVCALQGIALFTCLLPPLDQTKASVIAAAALAALTASFAWDIKALLMRETLYAMTDRAEAS
jgi:phosphatidylglycerophosphate synthase